MLGTSDFTLNGVTVSTINTGRMITFYNSLFNTQLSPVPLGDVYLYEGMLNDLNITLIPTGASNVPYSNGHHQLSFEVNDIEAFVKRVKRYGGTPLERINHNEDGKYCGIADPDGNTIVLFERKTESHLIDFKH